MGNLVLFAPYEEKTAAVIEPKKPEGLPADHVPAKPFETAARLARFIQPTAIRLKIDHKRLTLDVVGRKERIEVKDAAGAGVPDGQWFLATEAIAVFGDLSAKTVYCLEKDSGLSLDGKPLAVTETPVNWKDITHPRKTFDGGKLLAAVNQVRSFTGDAGRYDFDKVLLDPDGADLKAVACDQYTLAQVVLKGGVQSIGIDQPVLVPAAKALAHKLFAKAESVQWSITSNAITVIAGQLVWQTVLERGRFPAYLGVVPNVESWPTCAVTISAFEPVLEAVRKAAKERQKVELMFEPNGSKLSVEGQPPVILPVTPYTGTKRSMRFEADRLLRVIEFDGMQSIAVPPAERKPLAVLTANGMAVVMPVV